MRAVLRDGDVACFGLDVDCVAILCRTFLGIAGFTLRFMTTRFSFETSPKMPTVFWC